MNGTRLELTVITTGKKLIVLADTIQALVPIPSKTEGQFSKGTAVILTSGQRINVREFTGVIDMLLWEAYGSEEGNVPLKFFSQNPDDASRYEDYKLLAGRVAPTDSEPSDQDTSEPVAAGTNDANDDIF